jgi:hypothetical protein
MPSIVGDDQRYLPRADERIPPTYLCNSSISKKGVEPTAVPLTPKM